MSRVPKPPPPYTGVGERHRRIIRRGSRGGRQHVRDHGLRGDLSINQVDLPGSDRLRAAHRRPAPPARPGAEVLLGERGRFGERDVADEDQRRAARLPLRLMERLQIIAGDRPDGRGQAGGRPSIGMIETERQHEGDAVGDRLRIVGGLRQPVERQLLLAIESAAGK